MVTLVTHDRKMSVFACFSVERVYAFIAGCHTPIPLLPVVKSPGR